MILGQFEDQGGGAVYRNLASTGNQGLKGQLGPCFIESDE
jgi:hypothetical protein